MNHPQSQFCIRFFLNLIVIVFCFGFCFAQVNTRRQTPSPTPTTKAPMRDEQTLPPPDKERIKPIVTDSDDELINAWNPFNLTEQLPLKFRGHPFKILAQNLWDRRTQLKKDEFETTTQYEVRALAVHKLPIVGRLGENDLYAFVEGTPTIYSYDADKEIMSIKKELDRTHRAVLTGDDKIDWTQIPSLQLERKVVGVDYYKGSNLYGVVAKVEKVEALTWMLLVNNYRSFSSIEEQKLSTSLSFTFTVKPISARLIKPNLRLAYVCRLKDPWISVGYNQIKPTIDSPRDYNEMNFNLPVELVEVRCFNIETGEVYATAKPRSESEEVTLQERQAIDNVLAELRRVLTVLDSGSINTASDYSRLNSDAKKLILSQVAAIKDENFKDKVQAVMNEYDWISNVLESTNYEPFVNTWVISKGYVKERLISDYGMKPGGVAKIIYLRESVKTVAFQALAKLELANQAGAARKNALQK